MAKKLSFNSDDKLYSGKTAVDLPNAYDEADKIDLTLGRVKLEEDVVNHPSHYTFGKFEVLPVLMDWFADQPLLWQVCKYLARAKRKGNYLQDLEKAQFYLNEAIKEAKNVPSKS